MYEIPVDTYAIFMYVLKESRLCCACFYVPLYILSIYTIYILTQLNFPLFLLSVEVSNNIHYPDACIFCAQENTPESKKKNFHTISDYTETSNLNFIIPIYIVCFVFHP